MEQKHLDFLTLTKNIPAEKIMIRAVASEGRSPRACPRKRTLQDAYEPLLCQYRGRLDFYPFIPGKLLTHGSGMRPLNCQKTFVSADGVHSPDDE
jgi:hypothetical protein